MLKDPFKKLSRLYNTVQQGIAGSDRIFEVLNTQPKVADAEAPYSLPVKNNIDFINVNYSYGTNENAAVQNINLTIAEGEKIALVGFSGAGKSTLVDLVPRFMDPTSGVVKIGGVDISKVKLAELRSRIALVGQHTFLFNDTIYKNILYGRQDASMDDVYEAARSAYAHDFITQLPNGFETVIGESGLSLSGGERQRIAIARAILKNAPILILDEATASLDNRAEREVQSALETLEKDRTSLIIAHRLSAIKDVDRIIVLEDGKLVEVGSHDELLSKKGLYSELFGAH